MAYAERQGGISDVVRMRYCNLTRFSMVLGAFRQLLWAVFVTIDTQVSAYVYYGNSLKEMRCIKRLSYVRQPVGESKAESCPILGPILRLTL